MTDPSDFQIYFKDSLEEIITEFTAESPYECGTFDMCYFFHLCSTLALITECATAVFDDSRLAPFAAEIAAKLKYILSRRKQ